MGQPLTKYVSGSKTVDIQYDGKGIRVAKTRKIGTSVTTNSTYIYDNGGKLRTEIEGNTTRNYIYGQDGIVGYEENNEHFMYRKNIFGDVTAIYKGATKVAEYKYDAWGNCTIILNTSGYGSRNPFRYRGYYFDSDLGMYYLTTRYYDPKTGRFINADSIEYLKPDAINGLNLYVYCKNNPLRYVDPTGQLEKIITALWGMAVGIVRAIKVVSAIIEVVDFMVDTITAVVEWFEGLPQRIQHFFESLTMDDVHGAVGAPSNGSQNSSNVKGLYELYGGSGPELREAIYEEYGVDLGWGN